MTINCNGTLFKVHKCIVSSQGGYFAPDKQGFEVGSCCGKSTRSLSLCSTQGGDNLLQIHDEDPCELEAVIKYLYSIPYSVPDGQESAAEFHAGVYARAKYFQPPKLQDRKTQVEMPCGCKADPITTVAKHNFEEVATAEGLAGAHLAFRAAKRVHDDENEEDMQNDRGLKDILLDVLNKHKKAQSYPQSWTESEPGVQDSSEIIGSLVVTSRGILIG
ncbi:MAG: hypothetical protein Q9162_000930 [Coniocarpon cinnabarinum]